MSRPLHLAVILGSAREGRFCDQVAGWLLGALAAAPDLATDRIDAREVLRGGAPDPGLPARIAAADGYVVVTPEYNHGYPAALKAVIDAAYEEWRAKPAGFVSYGGQGGGIRAVEQLRLVFAELHVVGLRDGVSLANPWERVDAQGRFVPPEAAERALATMLDALRWWGAALAAARARPFALAG